MALLTAFLAELLYIRVRLPQTCDDAVAGLHVSNLVLKGK